MGRGRAFWRRRLRRPRSTVITAAQCLVFVPEVRLMRLQPAKQGGLGERLRLRLAKDPRETIGEADRLRQAEGGGAAQRVLDGRCAG
jgi:hypothetical protein